MSENKLCSDDAENLLANVNVDDVNTSPDRKTNEGNDSEKSFESCDNKDDDSEKSFASCSPGIENKILGSNEKLLDEPIMINRTEDSDDEDDIRPGSCREVASSDDEGSSWDEKNDDWVYDDELISQSKDGSGVPKAQISEENLRSCEEDLREIVQSHVHKSDLSYKEANEIEGTIKSNDESSHDKSKSCANDKRKKEISADPSIIPTSGKFYMHDLRTEDEPEKTEVKQNVKTTKKDESRWQHDLFDMHCKKTQNKNQWSNYNTYPTKGYKHRGRRNNIPNQRSYYNDYYYDHYYYYSQDPYYYNYEYYNDPEHTYEYQWEDESESYHHYPSSHDLRNDKNPRLNRQMNDNDNHYRDSIKDKNSNSNFNDPRNDTNKPRNERELGNIPRNNKIINSREEETMNTCTNEPFHDRKNVPINYRRNRQMGNQRNESSYEPKNDIKVRRNEPILDRKNKPSDRHNEQMVNHKKESMHYHRNDQMDDRRNEEMNDWRNMQMNDRRNYPRNDDRRNMAMMDRRKEPVTYRRNEQMNNRKEPLDDRRYYDKNVRRNDRYHSEIDDRNIHHYEEMRYKNISHHSSSMMDNSGRFNHTLHDVGSRHTPSTQDRNPRNNTHWNDPRDRMNMNSNNNDQRNDCNEGNDRGIVRQRNSNRDGQNRQGYEEEQSSGRREKAPSVRSKYSDVKEFTSIKVIVDSGNIGTRQIKNIVPAAAESEKMKEGKYRRDQCQWDVSHELADVIEEMPPLTEREMEQIKQRPNKMYNPPPPPRFSRTDNSDKVRGGGGGVSRGQVTVPKRYSEMRSNDQSQLLTSMEYYGGGSLQPMLLNLNAGILGPSSPPLHQQSSHYTMMPISPQQQQPQPIYLSPYFMPQQPPPPSLSRLNQFSEPFHPKTHNAPLPPSSATNAPGNATRPVLGRT